jgi:hypothetical protein
LQEILSVVQQMTVFLLIATLWMDLFSGTEYKKYLQYAAGLIVMVMMIAPILKVLNRGIDVSLWEKRLEVEQEVQQQEERIQLFEQEQGGDE